MKKCLRRERKDPALRNVLLVDTICGDPSGRLRVSCDGTYELKEAVRFCGRQERIIASPLVMHGQLKA